jgi:hypothetical protein
MFHRKSGSLQPILHTHLSLKALIVVFAKLNSSLSHGETPLGSRRIFEPIRRGRCV